MLFFTTQTLLVTVPIAIAIVAVSYVVAFYVGKWAYRKSGSSRSTILFSIATLIALPFLMYICGLFVLSTQANAYPTLGAQPIQYFDALLAMPVLSIFPEILAAILLVLFLRKYIQKTGKLKSSAGIGFYSLLGCVVLISIVILLFTALMTRTFLFPTYQGHSVAAIQD